MVTKAIIEQRVSEYQYRVRIPIFDRSQSASLHTSTKNLCIATISTSKGIYNNYQEGDVVFIAFENNEMDHPIIIGHLYREALTQEITSAPIIDARSINVTENAILPIGTTIGQIEYEELFSLLSLKGELQEQINEMKTQLQELIKEIAKLGGTNN